ncbi:MAG TPA: TetR/AcrR family transcriptional regulator [Aquamicrobium sp.]|nr:TetR/AcrR family transcriptional regulator [Aquamicrobium sp.]
MDAAERVFARSGFDGATTRAIADEASVNLGLIHYHFGSKEALFEQVIARHARQVNDRRRVLLAKVLADPENATLEAILDALMRPTIELSVGEGQHYSRIIVQIASGSDERSIQLTAQNFNEIALEFIDALERHTPGLSRENVVWAYMNAISVGMLMIARTGRVSQLSDGLCDESGSEAAIARVVRYLAAGTRALAEGGG